jgi:hypothetical protein
MRQKKRKKKEFFTQRWEESRMTKVMYLIEPLYIGSYALSPGLVEVRDISDAVEYYHFHFKGQFCAAPKSFFIEPLPVLMELF